MLSRAAAGRRFRFGAPFAHVPAARPSPFTARPGPAGYSRGAHSRQRRIACSGRCKHAACTPRRVRPNERDPPLEVTSQHVPLASPRMGSVGHDDPLGSHRNRRVVGGGRDLHRRADGTARAAPGPPARTGRRPRIERAAPAAGEQRVGPRLGLAAAVLDGGRIAPNDAGRRVDARQFLPDRGADPHRAATPARQLQPRIAATARRRLRRPAARLRPGAREHLARRRARRPGQPAPVRRVVPDDRAAAPGRAVGDSDHAAPGADRKARRRGAAYRTRSPPARSRRQLGRQDDRDGRARPEERDRRRRRHGALGSAAGQRVRRRTGASAAGAQPFAGAAADLGRAAPGRGRPDDRAAGAAREPAPGNRRGAGEQQHRQPARTGGARLACLRRDDEPRRARAAPGSLRRLRADGLRHARPLPARGGGARAAQPGQRTRGRAPRGGNRGGSFARRGRAGIARRLLPGRCRTRGARTLDRRAAVGARAHPLARRTVAAAALRRFDRRPHARVQPGARAAARSRFAVGRRRALRAARDRHQPARDIAGQPRRGAPGGAAAAGADGLRARHRPRVPHARRRAVDAHEPGRRRRARRRTRSTRAGEPRRRAVLRAAHRFHRRAHRAVPRGCSAARRRGARDRGAEPALRERRRPRRRARARASSCSTDRDDGIRSSASGWAANASAASSPT